MSGYTPVFDTVFTGTLHGRWPDTGLWLCLLAMQNKHGEIDCTPQYISSVTGLPVEEVTACIRRFMEPDEYSRSDAEQGRRLVPLDPKRAWGWRVVNHSLYRDKARKQFHNQQAVDSGSNKERMQTRRDQTGPDGTRNDRLSYANANAESEANKEKKKIKKRASRSATDSEFPPDFVLDDPMRQQALKRFGDCDVEQAFERFKAHHVARGSRFKNWRAAWVTWVGNFEAFGYPKKAAAGQMVWNGKPVEWQ